MKISVRLDDITADMDWAKFLAFKSLLDKYDIKPLIGVVPHNQDTMLSLDSPKEGFWEYIRELSDQGWIVAMHGYRHVYDSSKGGMFPLNDFSEFAGHSLEVQKEKLEEGKKILEENGIYTDFFMAPAHGYDENTLKALKHLGFTKITDGFGEYPYIFKDITFFPISFRLSDSLTKAVGYTTMVVHTNTIDNMEYYEKLFEQNRDKFISYNEYMKILPEPKSVMEMKKEFVLAKAKHYLVKLTNR